MGIFKVIFENSIIYKIFMYLLFLYNNSYLKKVCGFCAKVYYGSRIYVGVNNYINSTPLYKYSLIKRLNEWIYLFIVKHSEFLYNFVGKIFNNSAIVIFCGKQYEEVKTDILKSIGYFLGVFLFAFAIGLSIKYGSSVSGVCFIIAILGVICFIVAMTSKKIKLTAMTSKTYSLIEFLLKMEVSDEQD